MKNTKVTLESTTVEFNKWRERRKAGEVIPKRLWDMVAKIYDHYPHTILCQKLNLKVAQLKAKGFEPNSQGFMQETPEQNYSSSFVHVPPVADKETCVGAEVDTAATTVSPSPQVTTSKMPVPELPSVEIHRPDGVKIIFKHHDNAQLATVLQQLTGG